MYKKILTCIDNSELSQTAGYFAIRFAKAFSSELVGIHVYAARLHDDRFRQLEGDLPEKYQIESELERQRRIHDSLITKGLELISNSYLDVFEQDCRTEGISAKRCLLEGKNFYEIVKESVNGAYDLITIGAYGLGKVKRTLIGSVCERVAEQVLTDVLIVKESAPMKKLLVAVDGSPESFGALKTALELAIVFDASIDVVSCYDPFFHTVAFRSIADVLSEEAGKIFKFREQEKLHDEIIDKGMMNFYARHLEAGRDMALKDGIGVNTRLFDGKPYDRILDYIEETKPSLLLLGRFGIHKCESMTMGSTTSNLLRLAPCNILITSRGVNYQKLTAMAETEREKIFWTSDARERVGRIPAFARKMATAAIEDYARQNGFGEVNLTVLELAREKMGM